MAPLAVGTFIGVLWVIGLIFGAVALVLVVAIMGNIASTARQASVDAKFAYDEAEIMRSGVSGVEELKETSDLAGQVPGLTKNYLRRLN